MGDVVQLRKGPYTVTARELALQRWYSGRVRGPGIWIDQEALDRIEKALNELYKMGDEVCQLPERSLDEIERLGGVCPVACSDTAIDALMWLSMAKEISGLAIAAIRNHPPP